jgi:hypothetical protein
MPEKRYRKFWICKCNPEVRYMNVNEILNHLTNAHCDAPGFRDDVVGKQEEIPDAELPVQHRSTFKKAEFGSW